MAATPLSKLRPASLPDGLSSAASPFLAAATRTLHVARPSLAKKCALSSIVRAQSASTSTPSTMSTIITDLEAEQQQQQQKKKSPWQQPKPGGVAARWRELAGERDWSGLLDPMHPLLRSELIRYGEMAQACYDAYDADPFSRYNGSCKYPRRRLFPSLALHSIDYDVTRYLYATSSIRLPNFVTQSRHPKTWTESANWIGYVAVSTDEESRRLGRRDIVVAWRGTVTKLEWLADLSDYLKPVVGEGIPCPDPTVTVESGFVDLYTDKDPNCRHCRYSAREQVLAEVSRLVQRYTGNGEVVSLSLTGHSLGSALATLSAFDIAETGVNRGVDGKAVPTSVYSFSGPRVGNGRFKDRFETALGIKAIRVVNRHDTVPKVPGVLFNERLPEAVRRAAEGILPWWCYTHVGVELELDHKRSPFLKETGDPACSHNLEAHLHLLDGYHGKEGRFVLTSGRDPALVNKACDFLKDHHLVPPFWRQDANRGMVRRDGRWVQPERTRVDHDHDGHNPAETRRHLRQLGLVEDEN